MNAHMAEYFNNFKFIKLNAENYVWIQLQINC